MEKAIHYLNVTAWYINDLNGVWWTILVFFLGAWWGSARWFRHVQRLQKLHGEACAQIVDLRGQLHRLTMATLEARLHTLPGDPVLVHPEPAGADPAAPERHDAPGTGDKGV